MIPRPTVILASSSEIRQSLLRNAKVTFTTCPVKLDEAGLRASMSREGIRPRDMADALAEAKADRASRKTSGGLVIGCDQVLELDGTALGKPETPTDGAQQLGRLSGTSHILHSAAVIYEDARPVWRHVGSVTLTMHELSEGFIEDYVARNWESVRWSVGCYKIEEDGVRLFSRINGDYFTILGLPLLPLLSYLTLRGVLDR